jgi:hypothetical protein
MVFPGKPLFMAVLLCSLPCCGTFYKLRDLSYPEMGDLARIFFLVVVGTGI